jgi:hypothetical protein
MTVRDLMLIDDSETPHSLQSKKRVKRSEREIQDSLMDDTEN